MPKEGFSDPAFAAKFRDTIVEIVDKRIQKAVHHRRTAEVVAIYRSESRCDVQVLGDSGVITAVMGTVQPAAAGQLVLIEGRYGRYYVVDVLGHGARYMPGTTIGAPDDEDPDAPWEEVALAPTRPRRVAAIELEILYDDGKTFIRATWEPSSAQPSPVEYLIQLRDITDDPTHGELVEETTVSASVTTTTFRVPPLRDYRVTVIPKSSVGVHGEPWSDEIWVPAPTEPPGVVEGVTIVGTVNLLSLAWDPNPEEDLWRYRYQISREENFGIILHDNLTSKTSHAIAVESDGDPFYARVAAVNLAEQEGPWSDVVSAAPEVIETEGRDFLLEPIESAELAVDVIRDYHIPLSEIPSDRLESVFAEKIVADWLQGGQLLITDNTAQFSEELDPTQFEFTKLWLYPDTTFIDGGNIFTGTIVTNSLAAAHIEAEKAAFRDLTVTSLVANKITSADAVFGTAAIQDAYIADLHGDKITANTLDVNALKSSTMEGRIITLSGDGANIQSADFVAGSSGFRIRGNGNVEFNSGAFRGTVVIGSQTEFESDGYNPLTKITTFRQSTAPTAGSTGDLWIHTGESNAVYRWSGTSWVLTGKSADQLESNLETSGQTQIHGGNITTGLVSANHIDVGSINVNNLSGNTITAYDFTRSGDKAIIALRETGQWDSPSVLWQIISSDIPGYGNDTRIYSTWSLGGASRIWLDANQINVTTDFMYLGGQNLAATRNWVQDNDPFHSHPYSLTTHNHTGVYPRLSNTTDTPWDVRGSLVTESELLLFRRGTAEMAYIASTDGTLRHFSINCHGSGSFTFNNSGTRIKLLGSSTQQVQSRNPSDGDYRDFRGREYVPASTAECKDNFEAVSNALVDVRSTPVYHFDYVDDDGSGIPAHSIGIVLEEAPEDLVRGDPLTYKVLKRKAAQRGFSPRGEVASDEEVLERQNRLNRIKEVNSQAQILQDRASNARGMLQQSFYSKRQELDSKRQELTNEELEDDDQLRSEVDELKELIEQLERDVHSLHDLLETDLPEEQELHTFESSLDTSDQEAEDNEPMFTLNSMLFLLWKAVQELSDEVDALRDTSLKATD